MSFRLKRSVLAFLVLFLVLLGIQASVPHFISAAQVSNESPNSNHHQSDNSWTNFIFNYQNSRYIPSSGINYTNVCHLIQKWFYSTGAGVTSTPIVDKGVVYFADWGGRVYALNLSTGSLIWKTHLPHGITGTLAIVKGSLYVATGTGSLLYDLNALNGNTLWMSNLTLPAGSEIWSSPIIYQGRLYIGLSGSDPSENDSAQHGELDALNATTGAVLWSFDTGPGGGGVWGSEVVDTKSDSIFFGTGNQYPDTNTSSPYSDAVISLNATTGSLIWYNQVIKNPDDDFDFGSTPNLFTIDLNGVKINVVGIGSKDSNLSPKSNYYIFDRKNGTLLAKISSAALGGGVIGLAGYLSTSPSNTEVFVPTYRYINATCCGALTAFFVSNDTIAWKYDTGIEYGSVTVLPGAVLVGDLTGNLYAISTSTGQPLFDAQVPYGIADGITVVDNTVLFGNWLNGKASNESALGLYTYSLGSNSSTCAPLTTSTTSLSITATSSTSSSSETSSTLSETTSSPTSTLSTSIASRSVTPFCYPQFKVEIRPWAFPEFWVPRQLF